MADIRSQPVEDSGIERTIKTVLMGDFYENPTFSGIVVRTAITTLPIVDQIGDLQDIVAWVVKLRDEGWEGDFEDWVNSLVLGIGCIAVVGTAAKGVIKILRSSEAASSMPKLIEHLNFLGQGNGVKWLKEFSGDLPAYAKQAASKIQGFLDELRELLGKLKELVPKHLAQKLEEWRSGIAKMRAQVDEMFAKVADEIKGQLDEALVSFEKEAFDIPSGTKTKAGRVQTAKATGGGPKIRRAPEKFVDGTQHLIEGRYKKYIPDQRKGLLKDKMYIAKDDAMTEGLMKQGYSANEAKRVRGMYVPKNGNLLIREGISNPHSTVVHESLHAYSDPGFKKATNTGMNEGFTQHFTKTVLEEKGLKASSSYKTSTEMTRGLSLHCGEDALANAYFKGDIDGLKRAYEANPFKTSKGTVSFDGVLKYYEKAHAKDIGKL